jgi:branched-chain amino acid transport system ATP-binding protein
MKLLAAAGLTKRFGGLTAVKEVSFGVEEGEIRGVIGPNGAGKTTLFNLVAGTLKPDDGALTFRGRDLLPLRPHEICKLGIARTFQLVKPFLTQTVLQNALVGVLFGQPHNMPVDEAIGEARRVIEFVSLKDKERELVANLPFLDRKKVELARALATKPSLLLLDEPVAGLTPTETGQFLDIIRAVNQSGVTVLLIEHVMRAIMAVSGQIMVLHHGEKIAEGTPQQIANDPHIIDVYFGRA